MKIVVKISKKIDKHSSLLHQKDEFYKLYINIKTFPFMLQFFYYLYTLLVCLGVCLFVSNKRQTAKPIDFKELQLKAKIINSKGGTKRPKYLQ